MYTCTYSSKKNIFLVGSIVICFVSDEEVTMLAPLVRSALNY